MKYLAEITLGFDGPKPDYAENSRVCESHADAVSFITERGRAISRHYNDDLWWHTLVRPEADVIDFGSHTHFGRITELTR